MLVSVLGFGSIWRVRSRQVSTASGTRVSNAYYNSTGVTIHGCIRQRPAISGYLRFNGDSGFDPNHPSQALERVFECADPCVWMGDNKLLFKKMLMKATKPDMFIVAVQSDIHGALAIGVSDWRSPDTWLVALSEHREQQEAIMLMSTNGWLRTSVGLWVLDQDPNRSWSCRLRLQSTACEILGGG